jgi:hypothetical protein
VPTCLRTQSDTAVQTLVGYSGAAPLTSGVVARFLQQYPNAVRPSMDCPVLSARAAAMCRLYTGCLCVLACARVCSRVLACVRAHLATPQTVPQVMEGLLCSATRGVVTGLPAAPASFNALAFADPTGMRLLSSSDPLCAPGTPVWYVVRRRSLPSSPMASPPVPPPPLDGCPTV